MDNFSGVKVGHRLWSPIFGWGKVVGVDRGYSCGLVVESETVRRYQHEFNFNGQYLGYQDVPQCLFWDEVKIVSPKEIKVFDPNKPYSRRDGKYAKMIYTKADGSFIVLDSNEDEYVVLKDGRCRTGIDYDFDLVNVPRKIEGWINLHDCYIQSSIYDSKEAADRNAVNGRIACRFISFEEGEGLVRSTTKKGE